MNVLQVKNSYSEVFELLKHIDRNDLNKIPMELLKTIKENRNEQYVPKIDFDNINNSLSPKALSLYMWLYLTYISEDGQEKDRINRILYNNELQTNNDLKINDSMFEKKTNNLCTKENNQLVVNKPNILKKIIDKIRNFFKGN